MKVWDYTFILLYCTFQDTYSSAEVIYVLYIMLLIREEQQQLLDDIGIKSGVLFMTTFHKLRNILTN